MMKDVIGPVFLLALALLTRFAWGATGWWSVAFITASIVAVITATTWTVLKRRTPNTQ
jgi:sugar phosphate permease